MERERYINLVRMMLWYGVNQCGVQVVPWRDAMAEVDLWWWRVRLGGGKEFFQVALSRQISTPQLLLPEHQQTPNLVSTQILDMVRVIAAASYDYVMSC